MGKGETTMQQLIQIFSWALLIGSSHIALAHNHADAEAEVLGLDELTAAFGWDFDSTKIVTEKVAEGLYVLFGVGGNIGVSLGEDGVLIVDNQFPQVMTKLRLRLQKWVVTAWITRSTHTGTSITQKVITRSGRRVQRSLPTKTLGLTWPEGESSI